MKHNLINYFTVIVLFVFQSVNLAANDNMDQLLEKVESKLATQLQQESIRLTQFQKAKADKEKLLSDLAEELAIAKESKTQLTETFNVNEVKRVELEQQLQERSKQLNEIFSMTKKFSHDFMKKTDKQLTTARYPERSEMLAFANKPEIPTLADLKTLWFVQLQEIIANSGIQVFKAPVVQTNGVTDEVQVYQLGEFAALDERGNYLLLNEEHKEYQVLTNQPRFLTEQAHAFVTGQANRLTIDPDAGELLIQSTLKPTFEQRVHQGGIVGYFILALGVIGVLISVWRLLYMNWISFKIKRQLKRTEASQSNPLGRVLLAAKDISHVESAELLIDKALLQEVPKLERCHSLVKLLAAVAPLLGLLGTVTGMIETFQSITLLGASDPKLMAGGISQALITTVMGLCVAIPLLFCHSFITAKAKFLLQLVQQQSLLLLSNYYTDDANQQKNSSCLISDQVEFDEKRKDVTDGKYERSALA